MSYVNEKWTEVDIICNEFDPCEGQMLWQQIVCRQIFSSMAPVEKNGEHVTHYVSHARPGMPN